MVHFQKLVKHILFVEVTEDNQEPMANYSNQLIHQNNVGSTNTNVDKALTVFLCTSSHMTGKRSFSIFKRVKFQIIDDALFTI